MFKINRFTLVSLLLVGAYLLSACGGTLPQSSSPDVAPKVLAKEIVFTGVIEAMNGNQWVVSGQTVTVDPAATMDSNIAVGVIVKVEGTVSADGTVVALKVETSTVTDDNSNDDNSNDVANSNDDISSGLANSNDDNGNDDNSNDAGGDESEVFGVVESLTADSVTIGGVTYQFADFTEFKDAIAVGDQVKIHVVVNADGTFSIREIEKSDDLGDDNSNDDNGNDDDSNSNDDGNANDDNSNDDNSNDDSGDDNSNSTGGNSNDDDDDDDGNSNDD